MVGRSCHRWKMVEAPWEWEFLWAFHGKNGDFMGFHGKNGDFMGFHGKNGDFMGFGDGSKPWYLVNPKIAGKWMFIPLKMYL